jgi:ubiquinone/menaquinone biosynthesis C-methylase UbiE
MALGLLSRRMRGSQGMFAAAKDWDAHVEQAEVVARGEGFQELRRRIVGLAEPRREDVVVDLGSGTGLLTLAVADRVSEVWAVDSSEAMGRYLDTKAASAGLENVRTVLASAASLPLVDSVADLVVSNYCFHEMSHRDKTRALSEVMRVLRPGGRMVLGDMMFSLNPTRPRDRRVVADKLRQMARRGLPGLWRVLKNALRLIAGRWEDPANEAWWREALHKTGFEDIHIETTSHEGGIAVARRPGRSAQSGHVNGHGRWYLRSADRRSADERASEGISPP